MSLSILEATTEIVKAALSNTTGACQNSDLVVKLIEEVYNKLDSLEKQRSDEKVAKMKNYNF